MRNTSMKLLPTRKHFFRGFILITALGTTLLLAACSSKRVLVYESFSEHNFKPVNNAAKLQKISTTKLLKSGYLLIGYVDLKRNIRECYPNVRCIQISNRIPSRSALTHEAARRGGHIISLLDERRILKPVKKSYCTSMTAYTYWEKSKILTGMRCSSYGYKTGYLEVELTRALVWRYEPLHANTSSNYIAIKKAMSYLATKFKVAHSRHLNNVTKEKLGYSKKRLTKEINHRSSRNKLHKENLKLWLLRKAIRAGNVAEIIRIERALNHSGMSKLGNRNALMTAIVLRENKVARALIEREYDIHYTDRTGRTAVIYAIHVGDIKTTKLLIRKGVSIHYRDSQGNSLMAHAAIGKNTEIIHYFNRRGLKIRNGNLKGVTPLMIAVRYGNYKSVLTLIKLGADLQKKSPNGTTALMFAAMGNQPKVIRFLVSKKANVNARNSSQSTALMIAAVAGHNASVRSLVAIGAKINVTNQNGDSPLSLALKQRHPKIAGFLIDKGAVFNLGSLTLRKVLTYSVITNQLKLTQKLFNRGNRIKRQFIKYNIMNVAARYSSVQMIRLLVKNGVEVNAIGEDGVSPLMVAAIHGNTATVKALLRYKANASFRNKKGLTAMMIATIRGKAKVVTAMRNAGVKD